MLNPPRLTIIRLAIFAILFDLGFDVTQVKADFNINEKPNEMRESVDDAAVIRIGLDGFKLLSDYLFEKSLQDLEPIEIPDFSRRVPLLYSLDFSGVKLNPTFSEIMVKPRENGFFLDIRLRSVEITVDKVVVKNTFRPGVATSCSDISLLLGNHEDSRVEDDLTVSSQVAVELKDSQFKLTTKFVEFDVSSKQYQSSGPLKCKGGFSHSDALSRFVLKVILSKARVIVLEHLRKKIEESIPKLSKSLNEALSLKIPVEIPDLILSPRTSLQFSYLAKELELSDEQMLIKLAMTVESTPYKNAPSAPSSAMNQTLRYASLGINPRFVNSMLSVILGQPPKELELSPSLHEEFAELFKVSELSHFWPDLTHVKTDSAYLKLFVSLKEAPRLSFSPLIDYLNLEVPEVTLRFQLRQNEIWNDYFFMHLNLKMQLNPILNQGHLGLFLNQPKLRLKGQWSDRYTPKDPFFDLEFASDLFTELYSQIVINRSPIRFEIPPFQVAKDMLTLDEVSVQAPYLTFDLSSYRKASVNLE